MAEVSRYAGRHRPAGGNRQDMGQGRSGGEVRAHLITYNI